MNDIHSIIRNLKSRRNAEINLSEYADLVSGTAGRLAKVNLALNILVFIESIDENVPERKSLSDVSEFYDRETTDLILQTTEVLKNFFLLDRPVDAERVEALRKRNRASVQSLTDAIDAYILIEYVLNRLEHRFEGEKEPETGYNDLAFTQEILQGIASERGEAQNLLTIQVVEQLPVRMTKSRFYEMAAERLTVYRESDTTAFHQALSLIRTTLGTKRSESDDPVYRTLNRLYDEVSTADLKNLSEEQYRKWMSELVPCTAALNVNIDIATLLQTLLNSFAVLLLSEHSTSSKTPAMTTCENMISSVLKLLTEEEPDSEELLAAAYEGAESLEGIPEEEIERYSDEIGFLEQVNQEFSREVLDFGLSERYQDLNRMTVYLSNSTFADYEESMSSGTELSEAEFRTETDRLIQEISEHFSHLNKQFVRASMARFQSVLPPRFLSQEEIETYIYESLRSCTDPAEKLGCIEIIRSLIKE